jgi:hypothetical protein
MSGALLGTDMYMASLAGYHKARRQPERSARARNVEGSCQGALSETTSCVTTPVARTSLAHSAELDLKAFRVQDMQTGLDVSLYDS